MTTPTTTIRLPRDLRQRLQEYARAENKTNTEVLVRALRAFFEREDSVGLERESEIVPYRVTTLPGHRVGAPIGHLSSPELRELGAVLRNWLDLDERATGG